MKICLIPHVLDVNCDITLHIQCMAVFKWLQWSLCVIEVN